MSSADASIEPGHPFARAVFVCSAGHSGSTLLDLLLGSHPDAMSLGEITQLPKNLALNTACSCGAAVRECPVWRAVLREASRCEAFRGLDENPYALYLGLFEAGTVIDRSHQTPWRLAYRRVVYAGAFARWRYGLAPLAPLSLPLDRGARNKWSLFDILANTLSKRVLIDSSKHYLEAAALYAAAPERTKVILLVRDGRAVYYSGLKRGHSRRRALAAWLRTYRRALPVLHRLTRPEDLIQVKYEHLTQNPARELHRLCKLIDLSFDARMLDFRSPEHHVVNGNDMRLANTGVIRMDKAWKTGLTTGDLTYFERHAGSLNRQLGY